MMLAALPAPAQQRDGVADALAGHAAEMRQFGAAADPLRRAVYFDAVDVESAPAGVPCDHVAARRPEAVAGTGWVVLMESPSTRRRVRYWRPPGGEAPADIAAEARHFAHSAAPERDFAVLSARSFGWCR